MITITNNSQDSSIRPFSDLKHTSKLERSHKTYSYIELTTNNT